MLGGLWRRSRFPIGLDLGAHSIKLVQLDQLGGQFTVRAAASVPIPADLPLQGPQRIERMSGLVREALGKHSFIGRNVVSCMPASALQYKNLRLPKMPANELAAAVQWEAQDRLHLNQESTRVQFIDAGEVRQGDEVKEEIILLAATNASIGEHLDLLRACDLNPQAIDVVPAALARCAMFSTAGDESAEPEAQLIVDVGFACTKVLIARSGQVTFFKLIEIGGRRLDETVAAHLNLSCAEATELRLRLQHAAEGADQKEQPLFGASNREAVEEAVYDALRTTVGELAREIALCLRYYSVTFRGRRPESAWVVGGEAYEPKLTRILAETVGVSVDTHPPLPAASWSQVSSAHQTGSMCEWAVATGLSLRGAGRVRVAARSAA